MSDQIQEMKIQMIKYLKLPAQKVQLQPKFTTYLWKFRQNKPQNSNEWFEEIARSNTKSKSTMNSYVICKILFTKDYQKIQSN